MDGSDEAPTEESAVEELLQHLDEAKQSNEPASNRVRSNRTGLQDQMQRRTDTAVLASNHETRLEELVAKDAVTHRSGKRWKSAKIGVDSHGGLPIYYRVDGQVTHKGRIARLSLDPGENEADEFVAHITDDDTYGDYHDQLDTTTYIVTNGERLDDPFPQTELRKLSDGSTITEGYSYQPAYVVQRPGDFPSFP